MVPPRKFSATFNRPRATSGKHAFTLIELLVVVAIIALLIAILLPALARARDRAKTAKCLANLHAAGTAFNVYVSDNDGILPERIGTTVDSNGVTWSQDWDFGYTPAVAPTQWQPNMGTLSPYLPVNGLPTCPSMPPEMRVSTLSSGGTPDYPYATLPNPPVNTYMLNSLIDAETMGQDRIFQVSKPAGTVAFGETGSVVTIGGTPTLVAAFAIRSVSSAASNVNYKNASIEPNLMCLHNKQGGIAWMDGHATMETPWFSYSSAIPMTAAAAVIYKRYNFGWFMPDPGTSIDPATASGAQIRLYPPRDEYFTLPRY